MLQKIADKLSAFTRGSLRVIGTLLGIKWKGEWNAESAQIAGWVFILGTPIGMLLLGATNFSIALWFLLVVMFLMITNIDDALIQMSNYITYGVDGVVDDEVVGEYEKVEVKC